MLQMKPDRLAIDDFGDQPIALCGKALRADMSGYDPRLRVQGRNPLSVDSAAPSIPYRDFAGNDARFTVLERLKPDAAGKFMAAAGEAARIRLQEYVELSEMKLPESAIAEQAVAGKEEPHA